MPPAPFSVTRGVDLALSRDRGRAIVSRRCERDWSESTITGTWYFSAALNASTMMWKQSSTDVGAITTRGASPWPP